VEDFGSNPPAWYGIFLSPIFLLNLFPTEKWGTEKSLEAEKCRAEKYYDQAISPPFFCLAFFCCNRPD
jgi:hypothetical protein